MYMYIKLLLESTAKCIYRGDKLVCSPPLHQVSYVNNDCPWDWSGRDKLLFSINYLKMVNKKKCTNVCQL